MAVTSVWRPPARASMAARMSPSALLRGSGRVRADIFCLAEVSAAMACSSSALAADALLALPDARYAARAGVRASRTPRMYVPTACSDCSALVSPERAPCTDRSCAREAASADRVDASLDLAPV